MSTTTTQVLGHPHAIRPPGVFTAAWVIAGRTVGSWREQLATVVITWLFPVFVTVLFLGLFGGALRVPEGTAYVDFLVPEMLAVTMLFGLETTTLSAAADSALGINDRFRTFPIHSAAIVLGRCLADMLSSLVGLTVMVAFGFLLGWRVPDLSPGSASAALALLLLLRFALLWIGLYVGYGAKSVASVAYVQILVWPLAFFSSVFVNPATMPAWLGAVAEFSPVSATASTVRGLLGGTSWPSVGIGGEFAPVLAVAWPVLLTVVFLPLAARRFRDGGS